MNSLKKTTIDVEKLFQSYFDFLNDEDIACFLDICSHNYCKNKEVIVKRGSKTRTFGFIVSGLIRGYYTNEKGEEINIFLRPQGSFVGSPDHLISNLPTKYIFESVLESEIILYDIEEFEKLCVKRPNLSQLLIWGLKNTLQTVLHRVEEMVDKLPEERYEDLLKRSPIFFQKAFNKHIANYLGITPVSLSRIIKRRKQSPNH